MLLVCHLLRVHSAKTVLIYELVGPMMTKIALTKSGDIVPKAVAANASVNKSDDEDDDE